MVKNQHAYYSIFKRVGVVVALSGLLLTTQSIAAEAEAVEGQFIVKLKPGCVVGNYVPVLGSFPSIGAELWQVQDTGTISGLDADPCIEYMEPNYIIRLDKTPDDPDYQQLWGLTKIGMESAWDVRTESNVIIAVIDSGIDYTHPDIAANMWKNQGEISNNGQDDDQNGYVDDVYGYDFVNGDGDPFDDNAHGTHCAGTIAAVGNNSTGVVGINWSAKIMALKFLSAYGSGTTADAILAIEYATKMGAKITSNSWGGAGHSQALSDAIEVAQQKGFLFVAAAGNEEKNTDDSPNYPSGYDLDNIISVAATNKNDELSWFSNYGANTVDLGAPGSDIYSTVPGDSYDTYSGTSMATPHVAGVAGLLWSANPSWTYEQVKNSILSSVEPLSSLTGKTVTGGRLKAVLDDTPPPPPEETPPPDDTPPDGINAHIDVDYTTGYAPLTLSFSGSESQGPGKITKYKWTTEYPKPLCCGHDESCPDFMGDQLGFDEKVNFYFPYRGTYTVKLTVEDINGNTDIAQETVTLTCPSDPPGPDCSDDDTKTYRVSFDRAGFFVGEVILGNGQEGAWGLTVNPTSGMSVGGFNAGAILKENAGMPSYITFQLTQSEAVTLTPYEYTDKVNLLTVKIEEQDLSTGTRTTVYRKDMSSGASVTTQPLNPGYYVVTVYSQSHSPRGISGISVNAGSMLGSVDLGGWIDTTGLGFGAFYVASPQTVDFTLFSGCNYADIGAKGQLVLDVYYQDENENRELYWTNYPR